MIDFLFLLLLFLYTRLFFFYTKSWKEIKIPSEKNNSDYISVIVACRNEEKNISNLIEDVKSQCFDENRFEMIVVNDHSEDGTLKILNYESEKWNNLRIINLDNKVFGKKNAIKEAAKIAKGEIIICTDADCRVGENWIQTMSDYFTNTDCKFVSASIFYKEQNSLFSKYQMLEILSLVSTSGAAINRKKATICNGANLAFRKKEYLEIPDDEFNNFRTDDVSLLHYFKKNFTNSISFSKQKEAIVSTSESPTFLSYLSQKLRWISTSKSLKDRDTILVSLLVYCMNFLMILTIFLFLYFFPKNSYGDYSEIVVIFSFLLLIYLTKFISDYLFLKSVLSFFDKRNLLIYLFPFTLINAVFTVVIVPLSFIIPVKWKGRKT
ncbi:MAG: glycosyltransferase [Flavobacteriales bacterium]|jgi:cellulose synthase/poly-beta-1,6-N-acetylglucosamine synthase-like glycosyltransferase|nr:glycosyltransferase [Flavobacteriales bacterium]